MNGYERYLRTDELLSLQKGPDELGHRDEVLFQVVHQVTELWLKLALFEIEAARTSPIGEATGYVRRAVDALLKTSQALPMLEHISPWDLQTVREIAAEGSGFDSPGFRALAIAAPRLFERLVDELDGMDLATLYVEHASDPRYAFAEALISLDEQMMLWRFRHLTVVERLVGSQSVGTQGTPIGALARLVDRRFFPDLWSVRDDVTSRACAAARSDTASRAERGAP